MRLLFALLLVTGYFKHPVSLQEQRITTVDSKAALTLVNEHRCDTNFVVLDLRPEEMYNNGHIAGAVFYDVFDPGFDLWLAMQSKTKTFLLYCSVGHRSSIALEKMKKTGFLNLYHLEKGMQEWIRSGYPVERKSDKDQKGLPYLGQVQPGIEPQIFAPGVISTALSEGPPSFMPGGRECVYSVVYLKPHSGVKSCLITCMEKDGKWTDPEILFPGSESDDLYPFISYDGKWLFFQSNRPTNDTELKNKYNIWASERSEQGWGNPRPLPSPINGRGDVSGPSMSETGEFFFTLMSGDIKDGIYKSIRSDDRFTEPQRLPDIVNTEEGAFDGVISPDGSYYLVCIYGRKDSFGATDFYATFKDNNGNWTPLKNLGEKINTPLNEGGITISPDGNYLFFAGCLVSHNFYSDNISYADILDYQTKPQYGNNDVYWVSSKVIKDIKDKELQY